MKKILAIALVTLLLAFGGTIICCGVEASPQESRQTGETTQRSVTKLHIEGMTCGGCATSVKLVVKKLDGVTNADVSYEKKSAVITHDAKKISAEKIAEAIRTSLGYEVRVVETTAGK